MSISNQGTVNQNFIENEDFVSTVDFRVQSCSCIMGKVYLGTDHKVTARVGRRGNMIFPPQILVAHPKLLNKIPQPITEY